MDKEHEIEQLTEYFTNAKQKDVWFSCMTKIWKSVHQFETQRYSTVHIV